jgi:LysR family transcriptional regulator for bpeEF and oprC
MDHLRSIGVFVRTADLRSFAAAAAALGLTPSAVSKSIGALEQSLGVRLMVRGARGVMLTEEGARFYARCRRIVSELEAAEREATGSRAAPRGRLRVALHSGLARGRILTYMPQFLHEHPRLQIEVLLATGSRSLEAEGIDIGVFIGEPEDSTLVARRIAELQMLTCASTSYLEAHGVPRIPEELASHNCMVYFRPNGRLYDEWTFRRGDDLRVVRVRGNYCANEAHVLTEAAMAGAGVVRIFGSIHAATVASGALVPVLSDWMQPGPPVHVMYSRGARNSPKVRLFADFVTAIFEDVRPDHRTTSPLSRVERWPMHRA